MLSRNDINGEADGDSADLAQFDEEAYLDANPDVERAVRRGEVVSGMAHWMSFGRAEKRPLHKGVLKVAETRNQKIFYGIDKQGLGLEIGPSHNPIAAKKDGYNVHILDHLDTNALREKYKDHGVNLNNIEEVDFVWEGQALPDLIGQKEYYDWIIASHVIEHVPDFITFLLECSTVLKPEGSISLVIPDKRYCFDYFRPITTTGDVLDAFHLKRKRPSLGNIFDYIANVTSKNDAIAWDKSTEGNYKMLHSVEQAKSVFEMLQKSEQYYDIHCWKFVPSSFAMIINDLNYLGILNLSYKVSFDTVGCEFYVTLTKATTKDTAPDHLKYQQKIRNELLE